MSSENSSPPLERPDISEVTHSSLTFSEEITTELVGFREKHKLKLAITNSGDALENVLITAYYVTNSGVRYVIYSSVEDINEKHQIKKKISLKKDVPPAKKFYYFVEILKEKEILASHATPLIPVDLAGLEKQIKIDEINLPALTVIPGNPIIPRITIEHEALPTSVSLRLQGEISCEDEILGQVEETIEIGREPVAESYVYPLVIPVKSVKGEQEKKTTLSIKVLIFESEKVLIDKEIGLTLDPHLEGLFYQQAGYKDKETSIYDLKFVVMNLQNKTKQRFSGKAEMFFFNSRVGSDLVLSQKIREMAKDNYLRLAENMYLPPIFAGRSFRVICQAWLKNEETGEKFLIEGISPRCRGTYGKKKVFEVQIKKALRENFLPGKLKLPLEVRVKNNGPVEYVNLVLRLMAVYGNRFREEIAEVKIKNAKDGQAFGAKWKLPDISGTARIEANFYLRGLELPKTIVDYDSDEYFIVPKDFIEKIN